MCVKRLISDKVFCTSEETTKDTITQKFIDFLKVNSVVHTNVHVNHFWVMNYNPKLQWYKASHVSTTTTEAAFP